MGRRRAGLGKRWARGSTVGEELMKILSTDALTKRRCRLFSTNKEWFAKCSIHSI